MRTLAIIGILAALVNVAPGQSTQEAPPGMARYQVVLLKAGPRWNTTSHDARLKLFGEHLAYFRDLVIEGKLVAVGPTGGGDVKGILIFKTTAEEAATLAAADPAVRAGELVPDALAWLGTDGIGAGYPERAKATPLGELPMDSLQFALLIRGPAWTPEKTPEIEKLQAAHLAHIGSMAKAGKLVSAGPFIDGGTRRGIFIFRCSADEARAVASEDPMVKAGRLQLEFYSWTPNVDVIPAAKPG